MQIKFLKQIVEYAAGELAVPIVDLLSNKKDVSEFVIAKKLKLTINQTRNLLYRLAHMGILSSIRRKDKRKGWYIYFWTLNTLRSLELLESQIHEELSKLNQEIINKQSKRSYRCKICGIEVNEETALLNNFTCQECGEVFELSDNKIRIELVGKNINKLKKELELIRHEREEEQLKLNKKLVSKIKKLEKKKKDLRKKKSKVKKKSAKKVSKKKKRR